MLAVKGIYQGGNTVKLDPVTVQLAEPYEVIVAFLNPLQKNTDVNNKRRKEAFENFMSYRGTLPADFDYKKELEEYRDERYGNIN